MDHNKPIETRLKEALKIRRQMRHHGIDRDPGVSNLICDMNRFVRDGTESEGASTLSSGASLQWLFSNQVVSLVRVSSA